MKKLVIILILILVTASLDAKKVKFAVDMSNQAINATGVHLTGDFQVLAGYSEDWNSSEILLTQEANTSIYSIILDIPAKRKYEYKFLNGDQFYDVEFVPVESRVGYEFNDNRWLYIDSLSNDTTDIGAIKFGENAPEGYKLVRFKVDLARIIDKNDVHLIGSFSNWNEKMNFMYSFQANVHEKIMYFKENSIEFKFTNGNEIENVPSNCENLNGNRSLTISNHVVLNPICFEDCGSCELTSVNEDELSNENLIYPNPVESLATLNLNNTDSYFIEVFNSNGILIKTMKSNNQENVVINTTELLNGLYFVKSYNLNSGMFNYSKFVVNN